MRPRSQNHYHSEMADSINQALTTGIVDWQEFAQMDFKDLMDLVQKRNEGSYVDS